jgi:cytoskeletal protein RodZ
MSSNPKPFIFLFATMMVGTVVLLVAYVAQSLNSFDSASFAQPAPNQILRSTNESDISAAVSTIPVADGVKPVEASSSQNQAESSPDYEAVAPPEHKASTEVKKNKKRSWHWKAHTKKRLQSRKNDRKSSSWRKWKQRTTHNRRIAQP